MYLLALALPTHFQRDLAGLFGDAATTSSLLDEPTTTRTRGITHIIDYDTLTTSASVPTPTTATTRTTFTASSPVLSIPTQSVSQAEIPPTSSEEVTQWKVIGIGIITVGLIATVILAIVFFDTWWNFLCDLFGCGKRRKQGKETMVPDWEKRDWEFKLANEEGHRYPTISSLGDIAKWKQKTLLSPKPTYMGGFEPHPLEPLSRRPSIRQ